MRLKKTTLFILLMFLCPLGIYSQKVAVTAIQDKDPLPGHLNTIKAKYDIEFNFPQFDIAFTIPANTTFKVPVLEKDDVALEIGKVSYYCYDLSYLDEFGTRIFKFFESYTDKYPALIFEIERKSDNTVISDFLATNPNGDIYKYTYSTLSDKDKSITPVKSKLGTPITHFLEDDELSYYQYTFYKDEYCFNFYLDLTVVPDASDQQRYINIIESITPKNLFQKRTEYETRTKYRYYKKERRVDLPKNEEYKFDYYRATTTRKNKAINTFTETEIEIPDSTEYLVNANYISETGEDSLYIYVDKNDYINNKSCSEFYFMKDFNLCLSLSANINNPDEYIEPLKKNYKVSHSAKVRSDNTLFYIYFYGSKDQGTLDIFFDNGSNSFYNVRVFGYSLKNRINVHKLLSTYRWQGKTLPGLQNLIPLEEGEQVEFTAIDIPDPDLSISSKWEMMDLGLKFELPWEPEDYQVSRSGKSAKMSSSGIIMKAKPTDSFGLNIYSDRTPLLLFISQNEKPGNMEEALRDHVRSWGGNSRISDIQANVIKAGNTTWNVMIYQLGKFYYSTAITFAHGCSISLYVNNVGTEKEILEGLSYIKTFDFGKPLQR